jgi:oxalate decarboxylase/phosphoglucose isomerase-like protein (cupin superfamily)
MKLHIDNIGGEVVKEDDRYIVTDNKTLNNLVVSSTKLHPGKSTSGHAHVNQEEVYYFVKGSGKMELIDLNANRTEQNVLAGDVVLIPDGWFHRVSAGPLGCYFVCVFDGRRTH